MEEKLKNNPINDFLGEIQSDLTLSSFWENCSKGRKLYHFTSVESFKSIWKTMTLLPQSRFHNDRISDIFMESFDDVEVPLEIIIALLEEVQKLGYISFVNVIEPSFENRFSVLANAKLGPADKKICIELNIDRMEIPQSAYQGSINYSRDYSIYHYSRWKDIKALSINELRRYISENAEKLFFAKKYCYSIENEYRIILSRMDKLNIEKAISNIYIFSSDAKTIQFVKTEVNGRCPVMSCGDYNLSTDLLDKNNRMYNSFKLYIDIEKASYNYKIHKEDTNYKFQ